MKIVYSEAMVAPVQGFSPSAAKPAAVVAVWRRLWPELQSCAPVPATRDDLCRAHCPSYVDGVLALRRDNGFGTRSAAVNASLPYTSGALLTASRWALAEGGAVAAPVSGFHHAHWDSGQGFCTFNGLMVTAYALQAERPGLRIGILDYDYHYGDGTVDILERLGSVDIVHVTAGAHWRDPQQAARFLENIPQDLAAMANCDIVLYQAGADPHVEDPLGGFLTTAQLATRDWRVFAGLSKLRIPVAWDLAGGYQTPLSKVLTIHENTFRAAIGGSHE